MRLFIAVDVPDEIRGALVRVQQELRPLTAGTRWVSSESIHITLKFIGEANEARLPAVDAAAGAITRPSFSAAIRGIAFFPSNRAPRVLVAGVDAPAMAGLAEALESVMEPLGFAKENRGFHPHVTLGRARDARLESRLVAAAGRYRDNLFGSFSVDHMFLFRSTPGRSGSVYEKMRNYRLAAAGAAGLETK